MRTTRANKAATVSIAAALLMLCLAPVASAKLTGNFTTFEQCPYKNLEVKKCVYSTTNSGEVVLGSKKVPIVNPVVLQGGAGKQVEEYAPFFAAANGVTLSETP